MRFRTGQVQVHDGNKSIVNINELEYINGDVYANIWMTNTIAIINPIADHKENLPPTKSQKGKICQNDKE